ncbi:MAG: hypothetical protein ACK5YE_18170 [Planctomyces sp.]
MALLVNLHRDPKRGGLVKPDEFHPFRQRKTSRPTEPSQRPMADITLLNTVCVDRVLPSG